MATLTRPERLRLIEFMGLLAGLVGVIVALGSSYIVFPTNLPVGAAVTAYLVLFIVVSMADYSSELMGRRGPVPLRNLVALFTLLVSLLFGGAALAMTLPFWALDQRGQGLLFLGAAFAFNLLFLGVLPPLRGLEDRGVPA